MTPSVYSLDTNAIDWIIDNGAYDRVLGAVEAGLVELRYNAVQVQELAAIGDLHKRTGRLLVLIRLGVLVNTRVLVLDVASYLDFAEISDDDEPFATVAGPDLNHAMDAVIACGFARGDGPIITADDRLTKQCRALGIGVLTPEQFVATLPE